LVVGLAMQERIKALSVLALSGGLDPMDCQETEISRVQQKILGEERGKPRGETTRTKQQVVKTWGWWVDCRFCLWESAEK